MPTSGVSARSPIRSASRRSSPATALVNGSPEPGVIVAPAPELLPGLGRDRERPDVDRRRQQVDRVPTQFVGDARDRHRRIDQPDPVAVRRHLPPADPVGQERVPDGDLRGDIERRLGVEPAGQPEGRQPAGARDRLNRGVLHGPRQGCAVDGHNDGGGDVRALVDGRRRELGGSRGPVGGEGLQPLRGGDLGPVEDRRHLDPARQQVDVVVVVDGEVAERVGLRDARRGRPQRSTGEAGDQPAAGPHGRPPRESSNAVARGASSGEKLGLVSRARASVARACSAIPSAASTAPR